jgi:hypothetical protein
VKASLIRRMVPSSLEETKIGVGDSLTRASKLVSSLLGKASLAPELVIVGIAQSPANDQTIDLFYAIEVDLL